MERSLFLARHATALTTSSKDDFNPKLSALGLLQSRRMEACLLQGNLSLEDILPVVPIVLKVPHNIFVSP